MLETVIKSVDLTPNLLFSQVQPSLLVVAFADAIRGHGHDSHELPNVDFHFPRAQSLHKPAFPRFPAAHDLTQLPPTKEGGPLALAS